MSGALHAIVNCQLGLLLSFVVSLARHHHM